MEPRETEHHENTRLRAMLRDAPWRAELMLVVALMLGIYALGWLKFVNLSEEVRDEALRTCRVLNSDKGVDRENARLANDGLRSVFLPDPPNAAARAVIDERRELRREIAANYVSCNAIFDGE